MSKPTSTTADKRPSESGCSSFLDRCREWQRQNPEWELICDMADTSNLYETFGELPAKERMSWVGRYRDAAVAAWEEFGTKKCRYQMKILTSDMQLVDEWPMGDAMTVYKTNDKVTVATKENTHE